jgi:hypothetical protein
MGDINGNGLIDMLMGQGDGTIKRFEQTAVNSITFGTGTLLKNADGSTLDVGNFAKPTIADFDGDGLLELLVGEETGNVLRYEQLGATSTNALLFNRYTLFANPYNTASTAANGYYPRPTVADLDNNGLLDVLVGSNDGSLRRYEQTAVNATTFNTLGQMRLANGTIIDAGEVDKALLTDYDGDGYLDMLLGNKADNIVLYKQSAANSAVFAFSGNLSDGTNPVNMSGAGGYAAPAITDINGDGLLDLFVGNGNGTVYRFQQAQSATAPALQPAALASPTPLPVVLTSFIGQTSAAGNVLRWATASEANNDHFEVERSANGQDFVQIGRRRLYRPDACLPVYGCCAAYYQLLPPAPSRLRRYLQLLAGSRACCQQCPAYQPSQRECLPLSLCRNAIRSRCCWHRGYPGYGSAILSRWPARVFPGPDAACCSAGFGVAASAGPRLVYSAPHYGCGHHHPAHQPPLNYLILLLYFLPLKNERPAHYAVGRPFATR